jgi:hypothetical protein
MGTNKIKEKLLLETAKTEKAIQDYRKLTKPEAPDVALQFSPFKKRHFQKWHFLTKI